MNSIYQILTLTRFEPALRFVDHVNSAFTTHDAAVAVALLQRAGEFLTFIGLLLQSRRVTAPVPSAQGHCSNRPFGLLHGGRYWDRTSDPYDVNVVLYR